MPMFLSVHPGVHALSIRVYRCLTSGWTGYADADGER